MGSVQLFVLGIIGQYLGRVPEQTQGRPLFIVDRVFRFSNQNKAGQSSDSPAQNSSEKIETIPASKIH